MKKIFAFILTIAMLLCLVACGADNEVQNNTSNITDSSDLKEQLNEENSSESKEQTNQTLKSDFSSNQSQEDKKTHEEYVVTYTVYAEQGAVVTWFDPKTAEYKYKDKCEACGKVGNSVHSGGRLNGIGRKHNASFACGNPKCSMRGKPQKVIIGCSYTGEYVMVYD